MYFGAFIGSILFMLAISIIILYGDKIKKLGQLRNLLPSIFHTILYTYISFVIMLLYVIINILLDSASPITVLISTLILIILWWLIEKAYELIFGKKNLGVLKVNDKILITYFSLISVCIIGVYLWLSYAVNYSIVVYTSLSLIIGNLFSLDIIFDEEMSLNDKLKKILTPFCESKKSTWFSGIVGIVIFFIGLKMYSHEEIIKLGRGVALGVFVYLFILSIIITIYNHYTKKHSINKDKINSDND